MTWTQLLTALLLASTGAFVQTDASPRQEPTQKPAAAVSPRTICAWPPPPGITEAEQEALCFGCTSMLISKEASADGSTLTTQSVDGHYETRIHIVPGSKHAAGTVRPIMKGGGLGADQKPAVKVGEIPEVEQTFTRYDSAYPFMNEKQIIIGETTIGGRRELINDEGLFDIMELARLALERASTARDAIKLMGEFASKHGYGDSGECLTVGDPNEVWLFEVFGAGPGEVGAVWAARRVPAGEVGVSANRSRITTIDLKDTEHYLASANVSKVAEDMGWWTKGQEFNFKKAYSGPIGIGNTRREWRVLSTLAPSLKLDPWEMDLPFSVKPDKKVTPQDLMKLHRDVYEGTEFDMTKGLIAGPFGDPNRWTAYRPAEGFMRFERTIAISLASYVIVLQSRGWLPSWIGGLAWLAYDDAKTSCFVPFYAGNTRVPASFEIGSRADFDRRSAWWAFNFTSNWAGLNYAAMSPEIRKAASDKESRFFAQQPVVEKTALELYKQDPTAAREYITAYSVRSAQDTVDAWWQLSDTLITRYHDHGSTLPAVDQEKRSYPRAWLDAVGYGHTPIQQPATKSPEPPPAAKR